MTVFNAFMKVIKKHIGSIIMYTCIFLSIAISISKNNTNNTIENFKSTRLDISCFNHSNSMLADNLIQYLSDNHNIKSGINEDINSKNAVGKILLRCISLLPNMIGGENDE